MKIKLKIFISAFIIVCLAIILNSCKSNPTSSSSPPERIPLGENAYHQINITQTDYQNFTISNNENFILDTQKVSSIIFGRKNKGIFYGLDTLKALYQQAGSNFRLKFNFNYTTDDTTLLFDFTLRYTLAHDSVYNFDTSKVTYKYPYKSTEILIKWSKILIPPAVDIQAFDVIDSMIYFHPYGSAGMYQYNMKSNLTVLKLDYFGGDFLAATHDYVFCDVDHQQIKRFNLSADSVDLAIKIPDTNIENEIKGMCINNNKLYVAVTNSILVLNLDFQQEETIPYPMPNDWLAIKDSITFSNNWDHIIKYNLTTQSYVDTAAYPTSDCEAIQISGDKMFFTDYDKRIIGYVNLSEL